MIRAFFCADTYCTVQISGILSVTRPMIATFSNKISANKGKDSAVIFFVVAFLMVASDLSSLHCTR